MHTTVQSAIERYVKASLKVIPGTLRRRHRHRRSNSFRLRVAERWTLPAHSRIPCDIYDDRENAAENAGFAKKSRRFEDIGCRKERQLLMESLHRYFDGKSTFVAAKIAVEMKFIKKKNK